MKKVLLATDFSENSWNSCVYALHLFKDLNCTFFLVHTYTPPLVGGRVVAQTNNGPSHKNIAYYSASNKLENLMQRLQKEHPNTKHLFKIVCSFCFLTDEIQDTVSQKHIDFIIAGMKGGSQASEIPIGSNARRIINLHISCPILLIPLAYQYKSIKAIGFFVSLNRIYSTNELAVLKSFAQNFKGSIKITSLTLDFSCLSEIQEYHLSVLEKQLGKRTMAKSFSILALPKDLDNLSKFLSKNSMYKKMPFLIIPKVERHEEVY